MVYLMDWELPVENLQEAVMAYRRIAEDPTDGVDITLYWMADTTDGRYRGVAIVDVASEEALYEFFAAVEPIAEVRLTPTVSGDQVLKIWEKHLASE